MQWDTTPNAGFCAEGTQPWMRVMDDFQYGINAHSQMHHESSTEDELSTWQFWQQAIQTRKSHAEVFVYGDYKELSPEDPNVLAYERTSESGEKWLVVLNFSGRDVEWSFPGGWEVESWERGTYNKAQPQISQKGKVHLRPWEGVMGKS